MKLKKIWSAWDNTRREFSDVGLLTKPDRTMREATSAMSVPGFGFHEISKKANLNVTFPAKYHMRIQKKRTYPC